MDDLEAFRRRAESALADLRSSLARLRTELGTTVEGTGALERVELDELEAKLREADANLQSVVKRSERMVTGLGPDLTDDDAGSDAGESSTPGPGVED